jgi:Mg-chelatase subunit ChlD
MGGYSLTFNSPWFLLLLLIVPLLWWDGRRRLATLGRGRATAALVLRSVVVILVVLALAETQTRRTSRSVAVIYLLDQSLSIPAEHRAAMYGYVSRAVQAHRDASRGDRAGVIVFGREPAVEAVPVEHDLSWLTRSETLVPRLGEATDVAAALKLAVSIFPDDCARRVVLVSDGNENLGAAESVMPQLAAQGIGIDVVPIRLERTDDVSIDRLVVPPTPQQGQSIETRVVVTNDVGGASAEVGRPVSGTLRIVRRLGAKSEVLSEQQVELKPGKNLLSMVHTLDVPPGFYTYEAQFWPDDRSLERTTRNNRATGFAHVRGKARVLLIENADTPGQYDLLVERLREADILLDVRTSEQPFSTLAELQSYDSIVMANVPRTSGEAAGTLLGDGQIEALVRSIEMGCGLVMLGGPNSFGAGGWANTRLEEASPVDFEIRNAKVVPAGALVLVLDKSGSMQGQKIAMGRRAAIEAVRVLGAKDHIGVVAFDGASRWVVPMRKIGESRGDIARRIARLPASGGTNMLPAIKRGFDALRKADAAVKHMIVLTDGRTEPGDFNLLVEHMIQAGITMSAVAIGDDADRQLLAGMAARGSGKFYRVTSPKAVPRIFIKEAMRVARPVIYEREEGFAPQIVFPHEMLRGINEPLPPIQGFVLTDLKESPLVEVALRSPKPSDERTSTLLASWTYGLGRFVVFTTDAGHRWASAWPGWESYDALFTQIIRWSMRPQGQQGDFLVTTEVEDGTIRAVVTALDEQREFVNFLSMTGQVMTPELKSRPMPIRQTAPGRYVGELDAEKPGNYFLTIDTGQGRRPIRAGVNLPHSVEFKDKQTNWPLLQAMAWQEPAGGEPGAMIQGDLLAPEPGDLLQFDTFRPTVAPAVSLRDIWPLLSLVGVCVFFFDVLVRRVAIDPVAVGSAALAMVIRRRDDPLAETPIDRLRSRKAAMQEELEKRRAAARYEPTGEPGPAQATVEQPPGDAAGRPAQSAPAAAPSLESAPADEQDGSYTSRLLKAKRRIQQQRWESDE